jgi:hypothetical protein
MGKDPVAGGDPITGNGILVSINCFRFRRTGVPERRVAGIGSDLVVHSFRIIVDVNERIRGIGYSVGGLL